MYTFFTTVAAAVPEMWLVPTEIEMVHVILTTPFKDALSSFDHLLWHIYGTSVDQRLCHI